jgi:hypothetical protein
MNYNIYKFSMAARLNKERQLLESEYCLSYIETIS